MPRPPETTILAEVSSGRSDLDKAALTKLDRPGSAAAATGSIAALPPSALALSKVDVRTVMIFFASLDCTVAMALPA